MTNLIRLFLSSTFLDFTLERRLIHELVMPPLEEMARYFGLSLQVSDLRWGVTIRDIELNRTVDLCLDEVDVCRSTSPELNFLVLLGDRAGSRFVPEKVSRETLADLLARHAGFDALEWLEAVRQGDPDLRDPRTVAGALASDPAAARLLTTFSCLDPETEKLRVALAYSLTHREILRSGALDQSAPNAGVFAILREAINTEPAQLAMRAVVSSSLGARSVELPAPADKEPTGDYETLFVRTCSELLARPIHAARPRGTRSHRFIELGRPRGQHDSRRTGRSPALNRIDSWLRNGARVVAIAGQVGSGRTTLLSEVLSTFEVRDAPSRVIHLAARETPELQSVRQFAVTLAASLAPTPVTESDIEGMLGSFTPDLIGRVRQEIAHACSAGDHPLILVDDLDLVLDEGGRFIHTWLWSGLPDSRLLFTCGPEYANGLRDSGDVQILHLSELTEEERLEVATAICCRRDAAWLDPGSVARAAATSPSPGYVDEVVGAALLAGPQAWPSWRSLEPDSLRRKVLDHLHTSSPFTQAISALFLALCASSEYGVAEREFLSICQNDAAIHRDVVEHFQSALDGPIPVLVWHRLRDHFGVVLEGAGSSGVTATRIRHAYYATVTDDAGAALLAVGRERLVDQLWTTLDRPTNRSTALLPILLKLTDHDADLSALVLNRPFLRESVAYDHVTGITQAIARSINGPAIVRRILTGLETTAPASPEEQSHWLLDVSVTLRQLGYYAPAATAAEKAAAIRREHLGEDHHLVVVAVQEAADSWLEAGQYERAERLCRAALESLIHETGPALRTLRLRQNLASSLVYQGRHDEAAEILRQQLAEHGVSGQVEREMWGAYNGLASISGRRGDLDAARDLTQRCVSIAVTYYGPVSDRVAIPLANLGAALLDAGEHDEALELLERARRILMLTNDPTHPYLMNATAGYIATLAEKKLDVQAIDVLLEQLRFSQAFADSAVWVNHALRPLLAVIDLRDVDRTRAVLSRVDVLASAHDPQEPLQPGSPSQAATTLLGLTRGAQKLTDALQLDATGVKGFLLSAAFLWMLVVTAALRRELISGVQAEEHLSILEDRIAALDGGSGHAKIHQWLFTTWRTFAADYPGLDDCRHIFLRLRPEEGTEELPEQAEVLRMSAALALEHHEFDEAITSQREFARIVRSIRGPDSAEYAVATLNLASIFFRAARLPDAFTHYREGLMTAAVCRAPAEHLDGSVTNFLTVGSQLQRFGESAEVLRALADATQPDAAAISFRLLAAAGFAQIDAMEDAVGDLRKAGLQALAHDDDGWLAAVVRFALNMGNRASPSQRPALREAVEDVVSAAEAIGRSDTLRSQEHWAALEEMLRP